MNSMALGRIGPGFTDPAHDSQAVFRTALQALSMPGRPVPLTSTAQTPRPGHPAAAALLLALLDADCRLWLSPTLAASDAGAWLRFHTGCQLVDAPAQAQFCWVAVAAELPPLAELAGGSDEDPDQSATCVLELGGLSASDTGPWWLSGPGIPGRTGLRIEGLGAHADRFAAQWAANHAAFPRGVDLFLAAPDQLLGLPRSTRLEYRKEA